MLAAGRREGGPGSWSRESLGEREREREREREERERERERDPIQQPTALTGTMNDLAAGAFIEPR